MKPNPGNALPDEALKEFGNITLNVEKILKSALKEGGDLAELFFEETASTRILFESGRVDRITNGVDRGVGLRIIFGGKSVYGYTTQLTETSLETLAQTLSQAVVLKDEKPSVKSHFPTSWRQAVQPVEKIAQYRI